MRRAAALAALAALVVAAGCTGPCFPIFSNDAMAFPGLCRVENASSPGRTALVVVHPLPNRQAPCRLEQAPARRWRRPLPPPGRQAGFGSPHVARNRPDRLLPGSTADEARPCAHARRALERKKDFAEWKKCHASFSPRARFLLNCYVLLQRGKAFGCPKVCSEGTLCYAKAARTGQLGQHTWISPKGVTSRCATGPVTWRDEGPEHRGFGTFGWEWQDRWSLEENLMNLVLVNGLNCVRFNGFTGGHCSAVLVRPKMSDDGELQSLEVVGRGINLPSNVPRDLGPRRRNEIHAEVQVLARCARFGTRTAGCWMCIQMFPCWECCKALIAAGVTRVIFECPKRAENQMQATRMWGRSILAAQAAGMEWTAIPKDPERKEYVYQLWEDYKESKGLTRADVKALGRQRTSAAPATAVTKKGLPLVRLPCRGQVLQN
ncbi:unnamed protein product [Cladocopium goreaui]|uniref:CMP/dCMP-type deaminase domain-containing protein n=1 Tax=Cladocopium goreaui TaxID=2562237 RepID=A0A9P1M1M5_9DINO|nr:unnamed protein product [Cladocopium goreaui]